LTFGIRRSTFGVSAFSIRGQLFNSQLPTINLLDTLFVPFPMLAARCTGLSLEFSCLTFKKRPMPEERKRKLRLEIAHVLFIDIVGYSKLLVKQGVTFFIRLSLTAASLNPQHSTP
jgi:hypothetical protein